MTYYDDLNLPPTATDDEIRSRCRWLLAKVGRGTDEERARMQGLMRRLITIQKTLLEDRAGYDAFLREREQSRARTTPPRQEPPEWMKMGLDYLKDQGARWVRETFGGGASGNQT